MSTGRWSKRGWAFQSLAFRPWALAGGAAVVSELPAEGWQFSEDSRVWSMNEPETVFSFSKSFNIWNFTNEHIID